MESRNLTNHSHMGTTKITRSSVRANRVRGNHGNLVVNNRLSGHKAEVEMFIRCARDKNIRSFVFMRDAHRHVVGLDSVAAQAGPLLHTIPHDGVYGLSRAGGQVIRRAKGHTLQI